MKVLCSLALGVSVFAFAPRYAEASEQCNRRPGFQVCDDGLDPGYCDNWCHDPGLAALKCGNRCDVSHVTASFFVDGPSEYAEAFCGHDWLDVCLCEVQCKDIPPAKPHVQVEWIGCTGRTPRFSVTWWENASGGVVEEFEAEQKPKVTGGTWLAYFEGGETCVLWESQITTQFRVRAHNSAGTSDWRIVTASHGCDGGGHPF